MPEPSTQSLAEFFKIHERALTADWIQLQAESSANRKVGIRPDVIASQSREFLTALLPALHGLEFEKLTGPEWSAVKETLTEISATRSRQGSSPTEIARFVFSLKQPVFETIQKENGSMTLLWAANSLLDRLGLFTTELAIGNRQDIINRQQTEMLELSTPVVKLWNGILALPLIGTLDSQRTQVVMENLLNQIVLTGAGLAIIDITGVPTVDTQVAQHLLKTVAAARLMGAECIISGIRPQIASTIVHLGVDLGTVTTKATLADAFAIALSRLQMKVVEADKV